MVSGASHGVVPVSSATQDEDEIERTTEACIRDLQKISTEQLLSLVEINNSACKELADRSDAGRKRVKLLQHDAQRELGDENRTIFGDLFSLGNELFGFLPVSEAPVQPSASSNEANALMNFDAALDDLNTGPSRAIEDASLVLSELDTLRRPFLKLRDQWPNLLKDIDQACKYGRRLQTQDIIRRTLIEARNWRGCVRVKLAKAQAIAGRLEDFLDRCKEDREEKERWRAKADNALIGLEKPIQARIAALSWLRRARTVSTLACASTRELDSVCEGAGAVLDLNLEAAELAQNRLKTCIVKVLQTETDHSIATQGCARLNVLKMNLLDKTDAVAVASDRLRGGHVRNDSRLQATVDALTELLEAIDEVVKLVSKCPLLFQEKGLIANASREMSSRDAEALRAWVRTHLLVADDDDDDHE